MKTLYRKPYLLALALLGLAASPGASWAQATGTVSGTITGTGGRALVGASVVVAGTNRGSQTGADGSFTITQVPAGTRTLRATFAGYTEAQRTVAVAAGQTATVNILLTQQALQLEGLVAVGYGTQRKVNVTGAVEAVEGEELLKRPVPNVSQALQGVAAGVAVINRGGAPGRDQANVQIRGVGTLASGGRSAEQRSGALVLVDGVPGDLNSIPSAEIESISVLKDAASAAIYGSRAANGVILVTTRRGSRAGTMSVTYDGSLGIQGVTSLPPRVGMEDYIRLINEGYVNAGLRPRYSEEYIQNTIRAEKGLLQGDSALMFPHTDWVDEVYDPAPIQDHALRISGGNELAAYSLSVTAMDQQGMVTNTAADRYGVRLNTDFNLSQRLTAGVDFSLRRSEDDEPYRMGDLLFYLFHDTPPMVQAKYPDGKYGMSDTNRNSVADAEQSGLRTRTTWYGALTGKADFELFDGFTIRTLASAQRNDFKQKEFRTEYTFYDYFQPTRVLKNWTPNRLTIFRDDGLEVNLRGLVDYEKTFGAHDVFGMIGYDQISNDYSRITSQRDAFYNNELQEINAGDVSLDDATGFSNQWRLRSGFGRLNYSYLGKYLFEANARYDGSSRFAKGNRYGFFPSFSVGWRISEEPFFADRVRFIDDLKLRGSWGRLGNQDIGLYAFYSTVNTGLNQAFGTALQRGAALTTLANRDISWETTEITDLGVDLAVLDGRLSFTGDWYDKRTSGILLTLPIPAVIGRNSPVSNAGKVMNRGWEANLTWADLLGELDYSIGLNLSDNRNEVLDLVGTGPYIRGGSNNQTVDQVGYPIGSFYGFQALGLYQTAEEVASHATPLNPGVGPGDVKYADLNGDGQITTDDRTVIGDPNPRYTFGANFGAAFRGFDASIFLQGVAKVDALVNLGLAEGPNWENYTTTWHLDRWTPENRDGRVPRPLYHSTWNTIHSDWWIQDGKYMKLKNAQLGYTLPASLVDRWGVDRLRVYVTGQNVFTWSAMELELDPEFRNGNGAQYPQTRTVTFGTNLNF